MISPAIAEERIVAAIKRWCADDNLTTLPYVVTATDTGAMVSIYRGDPAALAGRLYIDAGSGTVYEVPDWVSRASAMEHAVNDPAKRARLAVI
jgi:hypothetical protein